MNARKKYEATLGELDRFYGIVDQALLVFGEGVRNFLHRDMAAISGNLQSMVKLGNDATLLQREIESSLYRQSGVNGLRGDILRLLERMGHIVEMLNNNLFQFEIERPNIPSDLNGDFLKLLELASQAVSNSIPACSSFFKSPDTVPDKIRRIYFYQKETDNQAKALKRKVFHEMDNLKLSEKVHLRYFALHIEALALQAVKVADQLSVMSVRVEGASGFQLSTWLLPLSVFLGLVTVAASVFVFAQHRGPHAPGVLLVTVTIIALLLAVALALYIIGSKRQQRATESRLMAREDEISANNRKVSDMEVQIMKMENDHLQNLLDLKRKETSGVVGKISEQKEFIDSIYGKLQQAETEQDSGAREAILHEVKTQLNLRRNSSGEQDDIYAQVEQLHEDFTVRLISRFPNLSPQERKLASLLRLGFSTKYMAALLNISPKSVEIERHRMRSKMGLSREQNLIEFIKNI